MDSEMDKKTTRMSQRLLAVASLVEKGQRVCDVGCDHGYVPIYLVQKGISPGVIAMDVREGPLNRAREHIEERGLSSYIETRLSDGLSALREGEASCAILAGMGGRLTVRILERDWKKVQVMKALVLQPQSDIARVRRFLREKGCAVAEEELVLEEGKYYPLMKVCVTPVKSPAGQRPKTAGRQNSPTGDAFKSSAERQAVFDLYGELLLKKKHPLLRRYLQEERDKRRHILDGLPPASDEAGRLRNRRKELMEEQRWNGLALSFYGDAYEMQ